MHRIKFALAALALSVSAQAALIFNNGAPTTLGVRDIGLFRTADDFALASAQNVAGIRFFYSWTSPSVVEPADNFRGTITYAIYNDSAGSIGSQIATGSVSGLASTFTGIIIPGSNAKINAVEFNLVFAVALSAGTYWLELHEGPTLSTDDGTGIGWILAADAGNAKQGLTANGLPAGGVNNELAFELHDTASGATGVPEPGSVALMAGMAVLAALRRR
ncbi:MAG: PEP-CTERM sorting domain-containing protein [Acidobacteria bacterium]|nr:PEP-CTERM sorting domain-containing protein [Acidobacteriota bacterium]